MQVYQHMIEDFVFQILDQFQIINYPSIHPLT